MFSIPLKNSEEPLFIAEDAVIKWLNARTCPALCHDVLQVFDLQQPDFRTGEREAADCQAADKLSA